MKIIPVFLPYAGCKHRCVFCDQIGATGVSKPISPDDLDDLIKKYLQTAPSYELAFYGGTFTGLPRRLQEEYLKVIKRWIDAGKITGVRISTRPDEIDRQEARFLKEYGVKIVEVGVQSMNDKVLKLSKRGHSVVESVKAVSILKEEGFKVGVHLMAGLPGSDFDKDVESAIRISRLGVDMARIHPTLVFRGSELYKMYRRGEYRPLNLEEALDVTSEMVMVLEAKGIPVIRIGLHVPVEQRIFVAAGPFHPSFGDVVRAWILRKLAEYLRVKSICSDERRRGWALGYGGREWLKKRGILLEKCEGLRFDGIDIREALKIYSRRRGYW